MAGIIRALRRKPTEDPATRALQEHAEQFDALELLGGQLVTGTLPASATSVDVRHTLGRTYRGALLCGVTGASSATYPALVVAHPAQAIADGVDTKATVRVIAPSASTRDETFTLWVF